MGDSGYRERTLSGVLLKAAEKFPAIILTGPRRSGKTTLARHHFHDTYSFCSLDDPITRNQAAADPSLLMTRLRPPVIIDAMQYSPELLAHVIEDVKRHDKLKGRYVITGSEFRPELSKTVDRFAGRVAVFTVLSMSFLEVCGIPASDLDPLSLLRGGLNDDRTTPLLDLQNMQAMLLRGGYPDAALQERIHSKLWHSGYVQAYLDRVPWSLRSVEVVSVFQRFMFSLAARTGRLMNFAALARELGVTAKTAKAWVEVLERGGQVSTVNPFVTDVGKRLVKRPKVFFLDTGTLAYLMGIAEPGQALQGMAAVPLFKAAVFGQLYRLYAHRGKKPRIHFWRTAAGQEVDFIIRDGERIIPVEARLTSKPSPGHAAGITEFQRLVGDSVDDGYVVCLCRKRVALAPRVTAVPLGTF